MLCPWAGRAGGWGGAGSSALPLCCLRGGWAVLACIAHREAVSEVSVCLPRETQPPGLRGLAGGWAAFSSCRGPGRCPRPGEG